MIVIKQNQGQQGFVLVMTLSMIAISLLASSYIAKWIDTEVENQGKFTTPIQQAIDNYSTFQTIMYVASTHPTTFAGIAFPQRTKWGYTLPTNEYGEPFLNAQGNELRTDSRLYKGIGNSYFRLQDEAGLISVNILTKQRITTLFAMLNVDTNNVDSAYGKLYDYIDYDSLYQFNGAEQKQYADLGLAGPANRMLRTPEELFSVLDWGKFMTANQFNRLSDVLKTLPLALVNINSAPKDSLLLFGLSPNEANKTIAFRETQAITYTNIEQLLPTTTNSVDLELFRHYASTSLRVTILSGLTGKTEVYHIEMTTNIDKSKPWFIRYMKTQYRKQSVSEKAVTTGKAIFNDVKL